MRFFVFLLVICTMLSFFKISYSQSGLSSEDIEYMQELKEKHLWPDKLKVEDVTPEILNEIRNLVNQMEAEYNASQKMEMEKPLTANELTKLDISLRSKWDAMRDALYKNEIERALRYFSVSSRNAYRNLFSALSKKECKQLAQDLSNIRFIREMGYSAEYDLRRSLNGNEHSFQIIFEKDLDGKWHIKSF